MEFLVNIQYKIEENNITDAIKDALEQRPLAILIKISKINYEVSGDYQTVS